MFERFLASGGFDFTDRDLIEMMLFYVNRIRDTRDIAVNLMETFNFDIGDLLAAKPDELLEIDGIGETSAQFLGVIGELAGRLEESIPMLCEPYTEAERIGELFSRKHFCHKHDSVMVAYFNDDMRLITLEKIKDDRLLPEDSDYILAVVKRAVTFRAKKIAVARLAGDFVCYPSMNDFNTAQSINRILKNTDISLVEYFIATPEESFAVTKLLPEK